MEKKLSLAKSDEERKALENQMKGIKNASVIDAFSSYSMQKSVMNPMTAAPRYVMTYAMPTTAYYGGGRYTYANTGYQMYSGGMQPMMNGAYGMYAGYGGYSPY